jgi:hypothetical protein
MTPVHVYPSEWVVDLRGPFQFCFALMSVVDPRPRAWTFFFNKLVSGTRQKKKRKESTKQSTLVSGNFHI